MSSRESFVGTQKVLLWALLVLVCLSSLPIGSNRPLSWTILAFFVIILFIIQLIIDYMQSAPLQLKGLWLPSTLFLLALSWGAVQMLPNLPEVLNHPVWQGLENATPAISADPEQGQHAMMRLVTYAMIFWIAMRSAASSARAEVMVGGFAIFSTGLAIFGIYALATGDNVFLGEGEQGPTLSASFINRNNYATYAVLGALANIAAYLQCFEATRINTQQMSSAVRDTLEQFFAGAWIFALGALICITAVALTQSRAGNMSGLLGLIVFAAIWRGKGQKWNPFLLATLAAVVGFVAFTNATGLANRFMADTTENGRFLAYPDIVTAIMDRPFLGHGLGAFEDVFRQYVKPEIAFAEWSQAHNSFLENAFELGLPAAFAFYAALLLVALRIRRGARIRKNNRSFTCFAFACIAAAVLHSCFDFSLQIPAVAAAFAMILGIGWAQSFSHKSSPGM